MTTPTQVKQRVATAKRVPELRAGDRLTRAEFERRYKAMPDQKKAELVEGVVYMPSPVSTEEHGSPHFDLITWLGVYRARTFGVQGGDNATLRLDLDNEPQPDAFLRILPEFGGQSRTLSGYLEGPPELIAEVAASSVSYDLHDKRNAYRRNGVCEYVVWRVWDQTIDWFVLRDGQYRDLPLTSWGYYQSEVFPGLWLEPSALVNGDLGRVLQVLQEGIDSPDHAKFVRHLQDTRRQTRD